MRIGVWLGLALIGCAAANGQDDGAAGVGVVSESRPDIVSLKYEAFTAECPEGQSYILETPPGTMVKAYVCNPNNPDEISCTDTRETQILTSDGVEAHYIVCNAAYQYLDIRYVAPIGP